VLAKKIYEITTESVISALTDELAERARRLEQMRQLTYGLRLAALGLLVWVGWMFSRRLRSEMAEQARLQQKVVTANEQLEQSVRERTADLEAANHQLAALSSTDALTGLANRRRFDEVWEAEWQRAARLGLPLALALIDVDNFKAYNDHYGHQAGDVCLRQVAGILAAEARRSGEVVARYGGEEFVLVLPGASAAEARTVAERIRAAVEGRGMQHDHSPVAGVVTVSIGVASARVQRAEQAEALLKEADVALYHAKNQGRNRVMTAA